MARQPLSELDAVFGALGDPTRRAILARLSRGEATVQELAAPHDMSLAAVSRHIGVLADAGLMTRTREGRHIRCRLNTAPLKDIDRWLEHYRDFWDEKLDALGRFLEKKEAQEGEPDMPASAQAPRRRTVVRVKRSYRVSVEAAFEAWTNPTALEQWFGPPGYRAEVLTHELRVGGRWRFLMAGDGGPSFHHAGTFIEIDPPRKLVFTWAPEERIETWPAEDCLATLVTVTFAAQPPLTEVVITHEQLVSEQAREALTYGWQGSLDCLAAFLESSEA